MEYLNTLSHFSIVHVPRSPVFTALLLTSAVLSSRSLSQSRNKVKERNTLQRTLSRRGQLIIQAAHAAGCGELFPAHISSPAKIPPVTMDSTTLGSGGPHPEHFSHIRYIPVHTVQY